jgi:hypothetical protein
MRIRTVVSLLLVAAVAVACGGSKPTSTPVPAAPAQNTPASAQPTAQPTAGAKEGPTLQPTVPSGGPTSEPQEYDLSQSSSLDKLDSYRATYSWKWSETKDGAITTGYWDALEEYSKADSARHTVWSGTEGSIEFISIGPYTYMKGEDGTWTSMLSSESNPLGSSTLISDPLSLISGDKGKLVQRGMSVNGVTADHYALAESAGGILTLGVATAISGDVYVAPDLQIVVKYAAHYEGQQLSLSGGTNGALDVAFDLTDINQPVKIVAPEGVAPPVPEDIPIIDGATELAAMSGVVSYKTTRSIAEVTAYYNEAMPKMGWQAGQGAMEGMLSFTKDQRQATVMMQAESGVTTVTVIAAQ